MKRPLAAVCLAVLAAVGLKTWLIPPAFPSLEAWEGAECRAAGRVNKVEVKTVYGKEQSVLYLDQIFYFETNQESSEESKSLKEQKTAKEEMPEGLVCYLDGKSMEEEINFRIGNRVLVAGTFESYRRASNPGEFDACLYYRILGLSGKIKGASVLQTSTDYQRFRDGLYRVKKWGEDKLGACYPEKEAGILMTMLFGDKTELDSEVKELYKVAGILHILSVSGLHVSLLGYGFYKLLRRVGLSMRVSAVSAILWMTAYGMMIGMGVSAFRAVLMFCVQMLAECLGRTYDLLTALAVAAVLLILQSPLYFFHSGFWLSFTCVLAIRLVYPWIKLPEKEEESRCVRRIRSVINAVLLSVSITIVTLPVFLWFYYEVTFWGILWNLLVIPLMSIVMGGSVVTMLLPIGKLSKVLTGGICLLLGFFERLCRFTESIGAGNLILGQPSIFRILLFVAGLLGLLAVAGKLRYYQRVAMLLLLTCIFLFRTPSGFQITFLDVGQGDGICLRNDNGNVYLIDGGSSSKKNVGTYQLLPFLKQQGISKVDAVFLSHSDQDHINGIQELLEKQKGGVKIRSVIISGNRDGSPGEEYQKLLKTCQESGTKIYTIQAGEQFADGALVLTCLHPPEGFDGESNASSQVLFLSYRSSYSSDRSFTALFTGDVEGEGEENLEQTLSKLKIKDVDLLKVAHHGSKNSTSEEVLKQLNPKISVISCGQNNSYGHPHGDLLDRLEEADSQIYRTDELGAVIVKIKDGRIVLQGYKKQNKQDSSLLKEDDTRKNLM